MSALATFMNPKGLVLLGSIMLVTVLHPFLGVLALLLLVFLFQARENYGVLEECGIPIVPPTLFRGSEPNLHKSVLHLEDLKRAKKYGGIWGSYVGRTPQIYISDPELIRLVFVKDFVYFGDRQEIDFGIPILNEVLDFLPGEKWRLLRTSLSPLFTTAKLKQMSDVMAESGSEFMDDLRAECDENGRVKFDCRKRLSAWLIDLFARSTLGIRLEDARNPDNKFASAFRGMMGEHIEYGLLFNLSLSFPILSKFASFFSKEGTELIETTFRQIIQSRRASGKSNSKDFLDVLCDLMDRVPSKEFQDLKISETTILAQAVNFFLGGYDTSATTLTHLLLRLAENPQVQEKMHQEVLEALEWKRKTGNDTKSSQYEIDHELIKDSEIPYVTACINESLRLAPPFIRPERICTKDWTHNGISIKKGTLVMLAAWPANRNPKVYPDEPDSFKPERFLPENKGNLDPYALSTFGFGPRNCIGMRFAYENLKLFACNLVKNFRVVRRQDTKLEYKTGVLFLIDLKKPLYVDLVQRK